MHYLFLLIHGFDEIEYIKKIIDFLYNDFSYFVVIESFCHLFQLPVFAVSIKTRNLFNSKATSPVF